MIEQELNDAIKGIAKKKNMKLSKVAAGADMQSVNLHQIVRRNAMTINTLKKVMMAMDEDLVLVLKDGETIKIK